MKGAINRIIIVNLKIVFFDDVSWICLGVPLKYLASMIRPEYAPNARFKNEAVAPSASLNHKRYPASVILVQSI